MVVLNGLSGLRILVTGGAGFIGSHVTDRLLQMGNKITVYDNLSSGRNDFPDSHIKNPDFTFIKGDLLDTGALEKACAGIDMVFHMAAYAEVSNGENDTKIHFEQNITATYNLLEAMRKNDVQEFVFTSSSTIYGEANVIPTPESYGPLIPISLYGASKLACEGLITAYSHTFGMKSRIFRFANIIGDRQTHGIIVDFIEKLKRNPHELQILGDGKQSKSYLYIMECIDAMMFAVSNSREDVNIFNIGSEDTANPTDIARIIVEEMGLENVKFSYTGGKRGWKGDVSKMMLDIGKLKQMGWKNKLESEESIRKTVKMLLDKE